MEISCQKDSNKKLMEYKTKSCLLFSAKIKNNAVLNQVANTANNMWKCSAC